MRRLLLAGLAVPFFSLATLAGDAPGIGVLYNTTEISSLNFEYVPVGDQLDCSFVQASIRKAPFAGSVEQCDSSTLCLSLSVDEKASHGTAGGC